jgi:hypothetical protein
MACQHSMFFKNKYDLKTEAIKELKEEYQQPGKKL